MRTVTCTAPVNIAVVKYWGKRDELLILPTNSSLSATLDQNELCATTTVAMGPEFEKDRMWLNGEEQNVDVPRIQNVIKEIRRRARKRKSDDETEVSLQWSVHIASVNNFPTAAGLASSAAGYACLVYSLAKLYKLDGEISDIARLGSGSACRSIYGGFVEWHMGGFPDGSDSKAKPVVSENHWPEMRIIVLVVSANKKHVGSSEGMQTTVATSDLFQHRINHVMPIRIRLMAKVIQQRDFHTFADLTMKDSNQFHAVCLDTFPPIAYLTDTSHNVCRMVHAINKFHGENKAAYTYDAGPNACLFVLEKDVAMVLAMVRHFFPPQEDQENFVHGLQAPEFELTEDLLNAMPISQQPGSIKYAIYTKVGPGPKVLSEEESLLGKDGLPLSTAQ